jgi:hypothetical protein
MLLAAVTILSAAAIAYEILLMRLFSIVAWHHFAYMIISLALLGYGVSGTVIALARERLLSRFRPVFAIASIAFALLAPTAFILAQSLPFNPLEIYWDRGQLLWLAISYLLLALPFLCAATAIGLALSRAGPGVGRIYFADLVGAGIGAPVIIAALFYLPPEQCLKLITAAGGIAALVLFADARRPLLIIAVLIGGIAIAAPWPWLELKISPYKSLAQILSISGMTVAAERPSPLGHINVIEAGEVPLRHAPGLSLNAAARIPDQVGIFIDGDGPGAITRFDGELDKLAFLDQQTSALPYHLLQQPATLVLGAGGGSDVLRALYHRAGHIDAVELNDRIGELMRTRYSGFSGRLYARPEVSFHVAEARAFLARSGRQYDLIQISLLDSFAAAAAGLYALNESTLYTLEAVSGMLRRLTPTGVISITRWLRDPPRDSVRLFATAVATLRAAGVSKPGKQLMMIRSWDTATLLISNRPFDGDAITRARIFTAKRGFDPVYFSGISPAEVNRRNVLRQPYLYDAAIALLGPQAKRFLDDYPYDISPTSDDRPYFFHTLKLAHLGTILSAAGPGRASLIEWGYVILWATLAQAVAASILLILLPVGVLPRTSAGSRLGNLVYFAALGLAFLFIEIAFIQRITLYLGHPLFAVVVVLASFLVFAGLGSRASRALSLRFGAWPTLCLAVAAIIVLSLCYLVLFPILVDSGFAAGTTALRIAVSVALISPLAFAMGLPFPLGLAALEKVPSLVPWAWGINGCASVISAALATLVAIEFGFTYVVIAASVFYLAAALAFPGVRRSSEQAP